MSISSQNVNGTWHWLWGNVRFWMGCFANSALKSYNVLSLGHLHWDVPALSPLCYKNDQVTVSKSDNSGGMCILTRLGVGVGSREQEAYDLGNNISLWKNMLPLPGC